MNLRIKMLFFISYIFPFEDICRLTFLLINFPDYIITWWVHRDRLNWCVNWHIPGEERIRSQVSTANLDLWVLPTDPVFDTSVTIQKTRSSSRSYILWWLMIPDKWLFIKYNLKQVTSPYISSRGGHQQRGLLASTDPEGYFLLFRKYEILPVHAGFGVSKDIVGGCKGMEQWLCLLYNMKYIGMFVLYWSYGRFWILAVF